MFYLVFYFVVLCCVVLCFCILCYFVLYCSVLCSVIKCCVLLYFQGAVCGEGVRRRNLTCVVHGGDWPTTSSAKAVDEGLCGGRLMRESEQDLLLPCSIPCPGTQLITLNYLSWAGPDRLD